METVKFARYQLFVSAFVFTHFLIAIFTQRD